MMFGSYGLWARAAAREFGALEQAWVRGCIALAVLLPLTIHKQAFVSIRREDWRWFAIYLVSTAFTIVPIYYALNHVAIGVATLIFYATVLVVSYLIGAVAFGERFTLATVAALVFAFAGLILIFGFPSGRFSALGAGLAALNGVASGTEVAISKKISSRYPITFLLTISWAMVVVTNLPVALLAGDNNLPTLSDGIWFVMIGYSIVGLLGFWFVVAGFRRVEAMTGGLIGLLEIVFAVLLGVVLLDEHVTWAIGSGMVAILLAGALPEIARRRLPVEQQAGNGEVLDPESA